MITASDFIKWLSVFNIPINTGSSFLPLAGGTMAGDINMNGFNINNLPEPTLSQQPSTKAYADTIAAGLNPKLAVQAASTVNLNATYSNGASGVGATLTNAGSQAAFVINGYTVALNDRIQIKNQTLTFQNGIYIATTLGSGSTDWVLTRSTDFDTPAEMSLGSLFSVENGGQAGSSWYSSSTVTTVGTSPVTFSIFFNPAQYLQVANNLSDLANISIAVGNLGLTIGTDTQAHSSILDQIAAGTWAGAASITTLGTISTGTWGASTIPINKGGTSVTSVAVNPAANAWAGWDSNKNLSANNMLNGYTSTVTAGGTTVLTVASTFYQNFTGSTTQTLVLPVVSTLKEGTPFYITNNSSAAVTVESSGSNSVQIMAPESTLIVVSNAITGTDATVWNPSYIVPDSSLWSPGQGINGVQGGDGTAIAYGNYSLAYGSNNTTVNGLNSFGFGDNVAPLGNYCFVFGLNSQADTTTTGDGFSVVFGNACSTAGQYSFAFGISTTAFSSAIGDGMSFAFGNNCRSTGMYSWAVGNYAVANNDGSWVIGDSNATPLSDTAANQFCASFAGGFFLNGGNTFNNNFISGYIDNPTTGGTITLTVSSAGFQHFSGTSNETVVLPVTSTLQTGFGYYFINDSTGTITIQSSGTNLVQTLAAGSRALITCIDISGTGASSWSVNYMVIGGGATSPWVLGGGTDSGIGGDGSATAAGNYSLAYGNTSTAAPGANCFAFGTTVSADGNGQGYSLAMGVNSFTTMDFSFAFGNNVTINAGGTVGYSFNFGNQSTILNDYAFAFGNSHTVSGIYSATFGNVNNNSASFTFIMGLSNYSTMYSAGESFVFGDGNLNFCDYGFSFGTQNTTGGGSGATVGFSITIGARCTATFDYSWALGNQVTVHHQGSVVWTDSNASQLINEDTANDQFCLAFTNGYFFTLGNAYNNNFIPGYLATATSGSTITLTVGSSYQQRLTGSSDQIILLPVTSTLIKGQSYFIINDSTGDATIESSGGDAIQIVTPGSRVLVTCIDITGTTAASWTATYISAGNNPTSIAIAVLDTAAVSVPPATNTDICMITLTPGRWRVNANAALITSGASIISLTNFSAWLTYISTASENYSATAALTTAGAICVPPFDPTVLVTSTQNVYLVVNCTGAFSGVTCCGQIQAVRID